MIKGKIVLYELHGGTLKQSKEKEAKWLSLPSPHKERFQKYFRRDYQDPLGRVDQRRLSYDSCAELIHADDLKSPFSAPEDDAPDRRIDFDNLSPKDFAWVAKYGSDEDRKKAIDATILMAMKLEEIDCDESSIDKNLELLIRKENDREENEKSDERQSEDGQVFRLEVPSDETIVQKIVLNHYKIETQNLIEEHNKDKTGKLSVARIKKPQKLEVAFTPSHLLAVALRSYGFQVIDEIAPSTLAIRGPMLIVAPNLIWPTSK